MESDPLSDSSAATGDVSGIVFGLGSVLSMSLATTIAKIALEQIPSVAFTALWATFGGILAIGLLRYSRNETRLLDRLRRSWRVLLAITMVSALAQTTYFIAIDLTHPALVVFLGRLDLVAAALLGVVVLKEKIVILEIAGAILALTGVVIMSVVGEGLPLLALLFGLTSATGAAVSLLLGKVAVAAIDPLSLTAVTRTGAGIVLLSMGLSSQRMALPQSAAVWLVVILASVLGPFLSYLLLYKALSATELFRVAILRSLTPFGVVAFSFFLLRSTPSPMQLMGGATTTLGIILVARGEYRNSSINKHRKELIE